MPTFKENLKEELRSSIERNTGIVGQALEAKRLAKERDQQVAEQVQRVNAVTAKIQNNQSTLVSIETAFTQISSNFQAIATVMGARAELMVPPPQLEKKKEEHLSQPIVKEVNKQEKQEAKNDSTPNILSNLFKMLPLLEKSAKLISKGAAKAGKGLKGAMRGRGKFGVLAGVAAVGAVAAVSVSKGPSQKETEEDDALDKEQQQEEENLRKREEELAIEEAGLKKDTSKPEPEKPKQQPAQPPAAPPPTVPTPPAQPAKPTPPAPPPVVVTPLPPAVVVTAPVSLPPPTPPDRPLQGAEVALRKGQAGESVTAAPAVPGKPSVSLQGAEAALRKGQAGEPVTTTPTVPRKPSVVQTVKATEGPPPAAVAVNPPPLPSSPPQQPAQAETGGSKGGTDIGAVAVTTGVNVTKVHPEMKKRFVAMAAAFEKQTGKKLEVTSGYRSNEEQAKLWNAEIERAGGAEAVAAKGGGNLLAGARALGITGKVAPPAPPLGPGKGSSHGDLHPLGAIALDVNTQGPSGLNVAAGEKWVPKAYGSNAKQTGNDSWLNQFGLMRPVGGENWHLELVGGPGIADASIVPGSGGKPATPEGQQQPVPTDPSTGRQLMDTSQNVAQMKKDTLQRGKTVVLVKNTTVEERV